MHKQCLQMGLSSFGLVFEYSDLQLHFIQLDRIASFSQSLIERSDQMQIFKRKPVHYEERITSKSLYLDWTTPAISKASKL